MSPVLPPLRKVDPADHVPHMLRVGFVCLCAVFCFGGGGRRFQLTGLRVLHELDLDDADDPRETTLYRLSFSPGLERFRYLVIWCSGTSVFSCAVVGGGVVMVVAVLLLS